MEFKGFEGWKTEVSEEFGEAGTFTDRESG